MTEGYPTPLRRFLITMPAMLAATMVAVDITIANVALPHMQASLGASQDQIMWVLTSYLISGAIATPLSGWLATQLGRKVIMVASIIGFTIASALCGASTSLTMVVVSRALQGACGAALIPLSQATLLDINPPAQIPRAMAIFSIGSMAGPIIGPTLGGWLTDALSWRWVFYINVPFGILSMIGMMAFVPRRRMRQLMRFDFFGFLSISVALASFQLMIDRGEQLDWFESTEIKIYAVILATALYLGVIHMFTARETFIRPALFKDRNFAVGNIVGMGMGITVFGSLPLIVVMTQTLFGYSAFETGLVGMPRAIGTVIAMLGVTRLVGRVDTRVLLISGVLVTAVSMLMYGEMDLYTDQHALLIAGFIQGLGGGLIFVPLSVMVFTTLPAAYRDEGAAMNALTRSLGNAVGISLLQRELIHFDAAAQARLSEFIRPDNPLVGFSRPDLDLSVPEALARLNRELVRQAAMVGNVELYQLIAMLCLTMIPLILMFRAPRRSAGQGVQIPVLE